MGQADQYFQQAAGFSGVTLSLLIRGLCFFLALLLGVVITFGLWQQAQAERNQGGFFTRLVMLLTFLSALFVILF